jgi:hypothetical protein
MRIFRKQFIMANKEFIDWDCEIKKLLYVLSTDVKTIADCRPKVINRIVESPVVGKAKQD